MPLAVLQPRDFTETSRFDAELTAAFEKSWVHVADVTDVPSPGDYVPGHIGRTPVLVVRGHDGELRAFLNACPHRGATLAESAGHCATHLKCPYHGWTFGTDGALRGVPFKADFDCDVSDRHLIPARLAVLGPMIFACLDPAAPPFSDWAGELSSAFAAAAFPRLELAFQKEYRVRCNWKTYVENGLEGYHIQFVHDFLRDAVQLETGENFFEPHGSYTRVAPSPALVPPDRPAGAPPPMLRFGHLFPNLIPVLSPADFTYLRIDPIGPEEVRLFGRGFDAGGEQLIPRDFRAAAFDATNQQDIAVVERVQRGLRARGLPRAVHCAPGESRITHFEKMLGTVLPG